MLNWFARRLAQTGKRVGREEKGFTLIELLVVVIIIGILAAIAIPVFLSQREGAQDAAAESDLRNLAAAAQSYYADNSGSYSDMSVTGEGSLTTDYGFNSTEGVSTPTLNVIDDGNGFTASVESASGNGFTYTSDSGTVSPDS